MRDEVINPEMDGIDHINIYSKGKTELGRLLTNFAHTPIETIWDHFESLEGLWYWLRADPACEDRQKLRHLAGYEAREFGKTLPFNEKYSKVKFEYFFRLAMKDKLTQTTGLASMLKESTLPFKHYYVYDGHVVPAGFEWITQEWERLRTELKDGTFV